MHLVCTFALAFAPPVAPESPDLATVVRDAGKALIDVAHRRGWRNVGVLKPLILREGESRLRDDVGTLNDLLGSHLQVAVLLQKVEDPVGVAANANAVAAKLKNATHLTPEGRRTLFAANYPLAWGDASASVDAFFTILACVSSDMRRLTMDVCIVEPSGLTAIVKGASATVTPGLLGAMGESYVLRTRGVGVAAVDSQIAPNIAAEAVRTKKVVHPAMDAEAPFTLEVVYDGNVVPLTMRDGAVEVPEPKKSQSVHFVIHRRVPDGRFGLVLKVNGENSLYRERKPDFSCAKWVSAPGQSRIVVAGFQSDDAKAAEFKIRCRAESEEMAVCYGEDAGIITLSVYPEQSTSSPSTTNRRDNASVAAVDACILPEQRPKTFDVLLQKIYAPHPAVRGLIGAGELKASQVRRTEFQSERQPTMCLAVRYYKP